MPDILSLIILIMSLATIYGCHLLTHETKKEKLIYSRQQLNMESLIAYRNGLQSIFINNIKNA